jgi:hypothetical protein
MPAKRRRGLPKKGAFLAAYVRTASITKAARAARIERALHYRWLVDDPEYPAQFAAAQREAAQILEDEAIRRANEGVLEPLTYKGRFQYKTRPKRGADGAIVHEGGRPVLEEYGAPLAIRKYSDGMMMFLLRGFLPAKYRENSSVELSGPAGGSIPVADPRLAELTDEELETLVTLSRKLEPETPVS